MRLRTKPVGGRRESETSLTDLVPWRSRARMTTLILGAVLLLPACGGDAPIRLPQPMSDNPPIDYPIDLWDAGIEGETMLALHVNADGRVDSVFVDQPSGSPQLDSAATRGGRIMRFTPARRGDRRVSTWVRLPVRFLQDSVEVSAGPPGNEGDATHE